MTEIVAPSRSVLPTPPEERPAEPLPGGRAVPVDIARGLALVAMAIYHFTWDLGFFGFTTIQASVDPGWRLFARLIAGSFLVLVGLSLVLAHGDGIRWGRFWRRWLILAGAAALVSFGTWWAMPGAWIFFGILHCIALSSLLALAVLRWPWPVTGVIGVVVIALASSPWFAQGAPGSPLTTLAQPLANAWDALHLPVFQHPAWLWLGLTRVLPLTNDYEPLLPWFGAVLLGVALGRLAVRRDWLVRLGARPPATPVGRVLALAGRNSLLVYLLHQPLLIGLLAVVNVGVALVIPPLPEAMQSFRRERVEWEATCQRACVEKGSSGEFCEATCGCVAARLAGEIPVPAPPRQPSLDEAIQACTVRPEPGGEPAN